jgi:hypothetical protein
MDTDGEQARGADAWAGPAAVRHVAAARPAVRRARWVLRGMGVTVGPVGDERWAAR